MPNERHYSNELNLESVGINLPYNMQAEQSVLGAVLLKPKTRRKTSGLCTEPFLKSAHQSDSSFATVCSSFWKTF